MSFSVRGRPLVVLGPHLKGIMSPRFGFGRGTKGKTSGAALSSVALIERRSCCWSLSLVSCGTFYWFLPFNL